MLKDKVGDVGCSANEIRLFITRNGEPAIFWMARSRAAWRYLPECYGPRNSVYQRFRRWAKSGYWQAIR